MNQAIFDAMRTGCPQVNCVYHTHATVSPDVHTNDTDQTNGNDEFMILPDEEATNAKTNTPALGNINLTLPPKIPVGYIKIVLQHVRPNLYLIKISFYIFTSLGYVGLCLVLSSYIISQAIGTNKSVSLIFMNGAITKTSYCKSWL